MSYYRHNCTPDCRDLCAIDTWPRLGVLLDSNKPILEIEAHGQPVNRWLELYASDTPGMVWLVEQTQYQGEYVKADLMPFRDATTLLV